MGRARCPPPTVFGVGKPLSEAMMAVSSYRCFPFKDFILTAKYVLSSSQCTITAPSFEMRVTVPNVRSSLSGRPRPRFAAIELSGRTRNVVAYFDLS